MKQQLKMMVYPCRNNRCKKMVTHKDAFCPDCFAVMVVKLSEGLEGKQEVKQENLFVKLINFIKKIFNFVKWKQ